jgi:hypothetical protein
LNLAGRQALAYSIDQCEQNKQKKAMLIPPALRFLHDNRKHFRSNGTVLDFGDQLLFDINHAEAIFPEFKAIAANKDAYERVSILYSLLGLGDRKCLDYNERADFRFNLNYSVISNPDIDSRFDLVTNQGFSEHVFNQFATFEAIHYTCRAGGLMFHVLPCQGWADGDGWGHGFYQYQPNFFRNLATANNYQIVDMQISPFSPDPFIFEYNNKEYSKVVNFHLANQEYISQRKLGRAVFASILVLLRMAPAKSAFTPPHE